MNSDVLKGSWLQLKGKVKEQWGKLTDDQVDVIDGRLDQLTGALQEQYGYQRDQAEQEIREFMNRECTRKC